MPNTRTIPRTARELFGLLGTCYPAIEGADLVFGTDPPEELESALCVLHTGIRAQLVERTWYGCEGETGRLRALNPAAPIPEGITLLCVEGDSCWDRVNPAACLDLPHLFTLAALSGSSRTRRR